MNLLLIIFTTLIRAACCSLYRLYEDCDPNQQICEIPSSHTLCPHSASGLSEDCLPYVHEPLKEGDKLYILHLHNKLRNRVANGNEKYPQGNLPPASNMLQLHWNVELEDVAERWAERCLNSSFAKSYDDCKIQFNVSQNIGTIGSRAIATEKRILQLFYGWYNKSRLFNLSSIDKVPTEKVGEAEEYTNLIWADSSAIGCYRVIFPNNMSDSKGAQSAVPWTFERIVCNYVPGGNIPGRSVYKRGAPCSECPTGMRCSQEFPGLCTLNGTETENRNMSLIQKLTTQASTEGDRAALKTAVKEKTSALLRLNTETFLSESVIQETKVPETERYLVISSPTVDEALRSGSETPKLLVKTGIYLNGKCHCSDISRFGADISKKLSLDIIKKFKNQGYLSTEENEKMEEVLQEGKTQLGLKEGDLCYCKKSVSNGISKATPSQLLLFVCSFCFFKLIYNLQ